ncbi:MAG TPA: hypothetical protein VKM72_17050 [Thermoanaerobaculia bacterium]|nr:hypothetical protein [Thermoanaerobaculia bacterium]
MNTNTIKAVQELKSERVQEPLMELLEVQEPLVLWLKSERVQEPESVAGAGVKQSSVFELVVNPHQRMTVELAEVNIKIILEGPLAGAVTGAVLSEAE